LGVLRKGLGNPETPHKAGFKNDKLSFLACHRRQKHDLTGPTNALYTPGYSQQSQHSLHARQTNSVEEGTFCMAEVSRVQYLSPREVGDMIGMSGDTIRRLIKARQLKAIRMPPGNHYKISAFEVLRYVQEHDIPLVAVNRRVLEEMLPESSH
jgi:excisionase family DNA binding protein